MSSALGMPMTTPAPGGARRWLAGVAGVLLVADALWLMGQRMFNVGVLLPLVAGIALTALALAWTRVQQWRQAGQRQARWWRWGWRAAGLWALSVAAFWLVLARTSGAALTATDVPSAIVVLGSGTPRGLPSPTLAARLDTALAQAERFPQVPVLVSGGVDFNEHVSEGQVMGDYLRAKGLAPSRIVQEERSTSTEENLVFSKPLLAARGIGTDTPIHIVTSDFHTVRAAWIARRAGYSDARAVGAPTPLYVRYNAWLREYFAVIVGFVLREF